MARKATGTKYQSRGVWYAAITVAQGKRESFAMPTCTSEEQAEARKERLNTIVQGLRHTGHAGLVDLWAPEIAARPAGEKFDRLIKTAEALCNGDMEEADLRMEDSTIRQIGTRWTSGNLAEEYRGQVDMRVGGEEIAGVLEKHVYPLVGEIPACAFTESDGQRLLNQLGGYSPAYVQRIAKLLVRLLNLAVRPLKLIAASPLPRGFVPSAGPPKARSCVFPSEDATLMACTEVAVGLRVLWGYLHREGHRSGEAFLLVWDDFDLARGTVNLDKNKTKSPRWWVLAPGVAAALRAWKAYREEREGPLSGTDFVFVFVDLQGKRKKGKLDAARVYRRSLEAAGITRPQLFQHNADRSRVRAHDTRAAFVTVGLANKMTETELSDRTGHTTLTQLKTYRRDARTLAALADDQLELGNWLPLDTLIPELVPYLVAAQKPAERKQATGAVPKPATEPRVGCAEAVLPCAAGAADHAPPAPVCDGEEAPREARHSELKAIVGEIVGATPRLALGAGFLSIDFHRDLSSASAAQSLPTIRPSHSPAGTSFV
jgi:integrase